ncbi:MAG: hypothetical protein Q7K42_06510 [Candidatus Diapherotrites archaeon]|nr:hypothetical protein [Candidatus Diapherotrites archaeon]
MEKFTKTLETHEQEILKLTLEGYGQEQIAIRLFKAGKMARSTVQNTQRNIIVKACQKFKLKPGFKEKFNLPKTLGMTEAKFAKRKEQLIDLARKHLNPTQQEIAIQKIEKIPVMQIAINMNLTYTQTTALLYRAITKLKNILNTGKK